MAGQAGLGDVGEHVLGAPADQRIDLDPFALGLEQRQGRARYALETLSPGDPGVVALHRLGEGTNFSDFAAAVGVAGEQEFLRLLLRDGVGAGSALDHVGQAEGLAKPVAIGERLGKMLAGVDENDRRRLVDLRHHMQ